LFGKQPTIDEPHEIVDQWLQKTNLAEVIFRHYRQNFQEYHPDILKYIFETRPDYLFKIAESKITRNRNEVKLRTDLYNSDTEVLIEIIKKR